MSAIKAGDLVMVMRDCCRPRYAGVFATVRRIDVAVGPCDFCGAEHSGVLAASLEGITGTFRVSWLKKVDPTSEPEYVERREELAA